MDPPQTGENPSPISKRASKDCRAKIQLSDSTTLPISDYSVDDESELNSMFGSLTGVLRETVYKSYGLMVKCVNSLTRAADDDENLVNVSPECLDCLLYFGLFPRDYEIDLNTMMQLWMAAGLVTQEPMEAVCAGYFAALVSRKIISFSRHEYGTGKGWWKVNECSLFEKAQNLSKLRLVTVDSNCVLPMEPCHVAFRHLPKNLEMLGKYKQMRAFFMLKGHQSFIDCLPYEFFISLNLLQTLDLSGTKLMELPNSVGNARCLRYLDLSETRIKQLPKTIESLQNLQTLKLHDCPNLCTLPKGMRHLISLRHLYLGPNLRHLQSMPPGMGALTCLRTLSEFVVGRQNGCGIGELKNMVSLISIRLSRLENVASATEAEEANLRDKQRLWKLELRWTDAGSTRQESIQADRNVMEQLWPSTHIGHLRILCYRGSTFPTWISDPSLVNLASITLFKCENCQVLPSLGQLRSLQSLSLIELIGVEIIDFHFCRDSANPARNKDVAFPKLKKLAIKSMVKLREWRKMEPQDFPCLVELSIKDCPKLRALCRLSNMTSLEYLEINHCGELQSLPDGDLPGSVKTLVIETCPLLRLSPSMEDTQIWHKTEHSPGSLIYQREEDEK